MTLAVYLVLALASAVFTAASAWRAAVYARSPMHLRWELYPVPHEAPERVAHGGSYFELSEWWRQPRRTNLAGELRFMVPEMLFLNALRVHNRPLWYRSFPFHFGLYLLAATLAMLLGVTAASLAGAGSLPGLPAVARGIAAATGTTGLALAIVGALGLLHRRLTDPALRVSTTPGDIFNLLFFVAALGLLGLGYWTRPAGAPGAFRLARGLLTWDLSMALPPVMAAGIVAAAVLAAYIPLTHMAHFVAKYFTYHSVRWDDVPLVHAEARARAMAEYLSLRPTWSAGHIRPDGASPTWGEIAAATPAREVKR